MLNDLLEKKEEKMLALFCIQFLLYYFVKKSPLLLVGINIFPKGKYRGYVIWVDYVTPALRDGLNNGCEGF